MCDQSLHPQVANLAHLYGYEQVTAGDAVLRRIAEQHGYPDPYYWTGGGPPGSSYFACLVLHVISQQISSAAAHTIYDRLRVAVGTDISPRRLIEMPRSTLQRLGLPGTKAATLLELAARVRSGELDLDALDFSSDEDAAAALRAVPGIGRWTAQMFLIHQLQRPDVLPAGDLAIRHAVQQNYGWPHLPRIEEVDAFGTRWKPHRTFAAALLWSSLTLG